MPLGRVLSTDPNAGDSSDEPAFRQWYAGMSKRYDLNPNPDDPAQFYDYRGAFRAKARPDQTGHWPSDFKLPGHPNLIVGGFHVQTGERVPGTPRAKDAAELVRLGWDAKTAAQLVRLPEPSGQASRLGRVLSEDPNAGDSAGQAPQGLHAAAAGAQGISETPWYARGVFGGGRGPSVQDALGVIPAVTGAVGGAIGAGGGTAFGVGFGGIPGALGGAALGGGAGEALKQNLGQMIGIPSPLTAGERAADIGTEGAVQAGAELGGRALAGGARALGRGMVENAVRPPISLRREFPDVIETIVKERLPVGAGVLGGAKGSERAALRLAAESQGVKALLARATAGGKTFESSKLAEPVLKLIDDIAEQPLSKGDIAGIDGMLTEFLASKKGPLTPLDVQKLKQAAQSIAKPIYRAVSRGENVSADQAVRARFNSAIATGSKEAMETIPGVAEGEAKKRSLIGAKKALSQAEMRRMSLMGEAGAAVMGSTAGTVFAPLDGPLEKSAAGWLVARAALSPRSLSRAGLMLTRAEAQALLKQFPRMGAFLLKSATTQETQPPEGAER